MVFTFLVTIIHLEVYIKIIYLDRLEVYINLQKSDWSNRYSHGTNGVVPIEANLADVHNNIRTFVLVIVLVPW